ncbi:hypothetical protein KAU11_05265, partial [Candidatus Babeliales bacterium]|nr:hypothetical protein [Candidatus Babeliales bacterium]
IDEYSKISKSKMICISNNKFNPIKQSNELLYIIERIKLNFADVWIHVLGAGYNHNNVKDWSELGIDSIDSISYYTDAQHKIAWKLDSYQTKSSTLSFEQLAIYNAEIANS